MSRTIIGDEGETRHHYSRVERIAIRAAWWSRIDEWTTALGDMRHRCAPERQDHPAFTQEQLMEVADCVDRLIKLFESAKI